MTTFDDVHARLRAILLARRGDLLGPATSQGA